MVGVVGGCFVFQITHKKYTIPTWDLNEAIVVGSLWNRLSRVFGSRWNGFSSSAVLSCSIRSEKFLKMIFLGFLR